MEFLRLSLVATGEATLRGAELALDTASANESSAEGPGILDPSAAKNIARLEAVSAQASPLPAEASKGEAR